MNRLVGLVRAPALTFLVAAGFFMPPGVEPPSIAVDGQAGFVSDVAVPVHAMRPTAPVSGPGTPGTILLRDPVPPTRVAVPAGPGTVARSSDECVAAYRSGLAASLVEAALTRAGRDAWRTTAPPPFRLV